MSYRFPGSLAPEASPTWVDLIRETNAVRPGTFGKPNSVGKWWAGGSVEEYDDARVLHRPDGTVSVAAKTADGAAALAQAATALGVTGH